MNKSSLLIKSLQNPKLFSHKVEYFKVIETHISWVLLTGLYAYKIKKPLNLGFLDFSTLEKRRHYCFEELRLNSRLAKDIYLDVVTISGTEEQPVFDDSKTAIEYAVKMRQFEPDSTFEQLLAQNQITPEQIKQLANIIADFHSKIEIAKADMDFGSAAMVMQPVRENFSQILQLDGIDKPNILKHLADWSEQQNSTLDAFFKHRKQTGFIRECHGDLHLGNIALIDSQVVPFDGIDFNPSLYWIDVICEIAFLMMDLQHKQRHDLAFQFLNSYLQQSGDYEGLKLMRFYLVYRAVVMAKVSAIRANQRSCADEHQHDINRYHAYLQLANSYTHTSPPTMIIMQGVSGSGKSWLSEQITHRYPVIRIRSDVERKRLHQLSALQQSHSDINSGLYSQTSRDLTYQHLLKLTNKILVSNFSVIVDATFLQQQHRKLFIQLAERLKIPFLIVHTQAKKQTLMQRIKERSKQKNNASEADQKVLENQLVNIQPLSIEEKKHSISIDTERMPDLTKLWGRLNKCATVKIRTGHNSLISREA
jgi:aminoglycoside phosphotransferase family enzyme/gluconate kinase